MGRRIPEGEGLSDAEPPAPVFIVHSLKQAVAVLHSAATCRLPVVLLSAPDAGISAGPGWFRAVIDGARDEVPEAVFSAILDCGDDAGAAQGAIRAGIEGVVYSGRPDVAARLAAVAANYGLRLLIRRPATTLDLEPHFFADDAVLQDRCTAALAVYLNA